MFLFCAFGSQRTTQGSRRPHLTPQQRSQCRTLRRASIGASLVDPLAAGFALRKSCEDMPTLGAAWSAHSARAQRYLRSTFGCVHPGPEAESFPALPGLRRYDTEDELAQHSEEVRSRTLPVAMGSLPHLRSLAPGVGSRRARQALRADSDDGERPSGAEEQEDAYDMNFVPDHVPQSGIDGCCIIAQSWC
jgi:hypothetical protein